MFNFDDAAKYNKDAMDSMMASYAVATKSVQAIATEMTAFSKSAFEAQVTHFEKLVAVKSVEAAVELQTTYAKVAIEKFVAEAGKISEMVTEMAKDSYKPYEATVAKAAAVVKTTVEKAQEAVAA